MRLYFDTETTGIPDRKLPWNHEKQPAIVSIAWALVEDDWRIAHDDHYLVKPDGWTIDEAGLAFAAHKIPQSRCEEHGVPIEKVLGMFDSMLSGVNCTEVCAYNIDFDIDMTRIASERYRIPWLVFPPRLDILPLAKIMCEIPPTEKMIEKHVRGFKPPKLSEALRILCKEEFPDAHDALADVRATIKIHRAIEEFRNGKDS